MRTSFKYKSPYDDGKFDRDSLFGDITKQMLVGAGVGVAVIVGPAVFIYVLYLIGTLLPPESKEADDPTPDSFSSFQQPYDPPIEVRVG